jgi:hypothetical protein
MSFEIPGQLEQAEPGAARPSNRVQPTNFFAAMVAL